MQQPTSSSPPRVLDELIRQHDQLRELMDHCEAMADELDQSQGDPLALTQEIGRLRQSFEDHNKFEEQLLRPVLLSEDPHGAVRIDRMVEDHVNEHMAMRAQLATTATAGLRDIIETLRAHLEAEERYLLTAKVLRDNPSLAAPAADLTRR